ncbi:MAG: M20 family metallopeptidase [Terriglobia bacterium]|nr:M20 family metallopeptidase [Terriglobia bacterium]
MKKTGSTRQSAEFIARVGHLFDWQQLLREFVESESPSHDKALVDAFGTRVAAEFEKLGGKVEWAPQLDAGGVLRVTFEAAAHKRPILLLGHLDTVYEPGSLERMPCRVAGGKMYGPGVFDMKGGIVMMLLAIAALKEQHGRLPRPVIVLLNPDEEVGSRVSRKITEKLAKKCAAVLVLEPSAGPNGKCKTARKGVGDYRLRVTGVSAHAGLDFQKGANAITELAHQLTKIAALTDLKRGTTLNPGIIRGGTRTNVVPDLAEAEFDIRITSRKEGERIDRKIRALKPRDKRCKLEISGGVNRNPFERTKEVAALYGKAHDIAAELGFELEETSVGGGSDGNFTAGVGVPTLDGLGAVGDGAHALHEHVILQEIPRRAALVARLIETI